MSSRTPTEFEKRFRPVPFQRVEELFDAMEIKPPEPVANGKPPFPVEVLVKASLPPAVHLKYPSVSIDDLPQTHSAVGEAALKIARFMRLLPKLQEPIPPPVPTPLNMEIKPFNVVKYLKIFHDENADIVNQESTRQHRNAWKWRNSRLASFALMMSKTRYRDMAYDLMVLIDRSFELMNQNEDLRSKRSKLHVNKEFFLDRYHNIGSFLSDVFISGDMNFRYLRGNFSHEYMRQLAKLWHEVFGLEDRKLAVSDQVRLRQKYPEIPNVSWKELPFVDRMILMEQKILKDRMKKIDAPKKVPAASSRVYTSPYPTNIAKITI